MNIHHLELFYYVAKHGGVSEAARRIPYGIQQPAISAQIIQLEDSLGVTLFQRRPFRLSKPGEELFQFIEPFFSGISEMEKKLRGGGEVIIRVGTVETIQRHYLPRVLKGVRARFPKVTFSLSAASTDEVESRLLSQEIDLGIAPLLGRRPAGVKQKELARAPMALMIPESKKLSAAESLWKQDRISEPLIVVGAGRAVTRLFCPPCKSKAWNGFRAWNSIHRIWFPAMSPRDLASAWWWSNPESPRRKARGSCRCRGSRKSLWIALDGRHDAAADGISRRGGIIDREFAGARKSAAGVAAKRRKRLKKN